MLNNRHQIAVNPVVQTGPSSNAEELSGPEILLINPAQVALATPCKWANTSGIHPGTLLHFCGNIPPVKISMSIHHWNMFVAENSR